MLEAGQHHGGGAWVTASEVASFAYCPEQWRLEHGLKLPPSNAAARRAGVRHHARKAGQERLAGGLFALVPVILLALVIGLALLFWHFG